MTLQQEKENLENRLREIEIELEKQPKIGDVCWFWGTNKVNLVIGILERENEPYKYDKSGVGYPNCEKITDPYIVNFVKGVKKYTIEDLRNGVCAVKNDSTIEDLRVVLIRTFLDCKSIPSGGANFYFKSEEDHYWDCEDETDLPTQSVKDFL